LREPSNLTHVALEAAKTTVAIALEILDTEVRWLASTRATTVTGLKLKASYVPDEAGGARAFCPGCGRVWLRDLDSNQD